MARFRSNKTLKNTKTGHIFTYSPEKEGLPDLVVCDLKGNPIPSTPVSESGGPETPEEAFEQATPAPATPKTTRKSAASRLSALPQE